MCRRSAAPTSAGTGTTGTPAIRQPTTASTVDAVGVASTATRCTPPMRSATDVAPPTRSLRLSVAPSMRTASPMSDPPATAAGFNEAKQHVSEATRGRVRSTRRHLHGVPSRGRRYGRRGRTDHQPHQCLVEQREDPELAEHLGTTTARKPWRDERFGSADTMRRTFRHALGVSPSMYRSRFRTTGTHQNF